MEVIDRDIVKAKEAVNKYGGLNLDTAYARSPAARDISAWGVETE